MFEQLLIKLKNMDCIIKKITKKGFLFSFSVAIISVLILVTYMTFYASPDLYYIGLTLFKTSLYFAIEFFVCAFAFDTIKKQMV